MNAVIFWGHAGVIEIQPDCGHGCCRRVGFVDLRRDAEENSRRHSWRLSRLRRRCSAEPSLRRGSIEPQVATMNRKAVSEGIFRLKIVCFARCCSVCVSATKWLLCISAGRSGSGNAAAYVAKTSTLRRRPRITWQKTGAAIGAQIRDLRWARRAVSSSACRRSMLQLSAGSAASSSPVSSLRASSSTVAIRL